MYKDELLFTADVYFNFMLEHKLLDTDHPFQCWKVLWHIGALKKAKGQ